MHFSDAFACPEGYFKCNNGKCLRESKVCDGSYDDCGDESDESNCSKCLWSMSVTTIIRPFLYSANKECSGSVGGVNQNCLGRFREVPWNQTTDVHRGSTLIVQMIT